MGKRNTTLIGLVFLLFLSGCTSFIPYREELKEEDIHYVPPAALSGQWADFASTYFAVTRFGAVEANPLMAPLTEGPLGFATMFGLKTGLTFYAYNQELESCAAATAFSSSLGWGAFIYNVLHLTTSLAHPPLIIISVVGGANAGYWWHTSNNAHRECIQGKQFIQYLMREPDEIETNFQHTTR